MISSEGIKYIKIEENSTPNNWKNYLFAANIDYVSVIMQYHTGVIQLGTVLWLVQQSIEKYCKALLNKSDLAEFSEEKLSKKPYGHNLNFLWEKVCEKNAYFSSIVEYSEFIKEMNTITTNTRYMNYQSIFNLGFIEIFILLGCDFRYEINQREKFMSSFFGINTDLMFIPKTFYGGEFFKTFYKKILHLSIEHGISFSHSGIPYTYSENASRLSSKFCQCKKHLEVENECPMCKKELFITGSRTEADAEKLEYYLLKDKGL